MILQSCPIRSHQLPSPLPAPRPLQRDSSRGNRIEMPVRRLSPQSHLVRPLLLLCAVRAGGGSMISNDFSIVQTRCRHYCLAATPQHGWQAAALWRLSLVFFLTSGPASRMSVSAYIMGSFANHFNFRSLQQNLN